MVPCKSSEKQATVYLLLSGGFNDFQESLLSGDCMSRKSLQQAEMVSGEPTSIGFLLRSVLPRGLIFLGQWISNSEMCLSICEDGSLLSVFSEIIKMFLHA